MPNLFKIVWQRSKVLEHLHDNSEVCLVNVLLRMPKLHQQEIDDANDAQRRMEKQSARKGDHPKYSEALVSQCFGPMIRIIAPTMHNRKSRFPLFENHLKCGTAARGVDFSVVRNLMLGIADDGDEELPLDVLHEALGLVT